MTQVLSPSSASPRVVLDDLRGVREHDATEPVLLDASGQRARSLGRAGRVVAAVMSVWLVGLVFAGLGLVPANLIPFGTFVRAKMITQGLTLAGNREAARGAAAARITGSRVLPYGTSGGFNATNTGATAQRWRAAGERPGVDGRGERRSPGTRGGSGSGSDIPTSLLSPTAAATEPVRPSADPLNDHPSDERATATMPSEMPRGATPTFSAPVAASPHRTSASPSSAPAGDVTTETAAPGRSETAPGQAPGGNANANPGNASPPSGGNATPGGSGNGNGNPAGNGAANPTQNGNPSGSSLADPAANGNPGGNGNASQANDGNANPGGGGSSPAGNGAPAGNGGAPESNARGTSQAGNTGGASSTSAGAGSGNGAPSGGTGKQSSQAGGPGSGSAGRGNAGH